MLQVHSLPPPRDARPSAMNANTAHRSMRPSLQNTMLATRSVSTRALMMERSGSTRNMTRALPILQRAESTRNMRSLPSARRSHPSARRFFVPADNNISNTGSRAQDAAALANHFRRSMMERTNSNSSIGSNYSGNSMRSLCSNSEHSDSNLSTFSLDNLSINSRSPPQSSSPESNGNNSQSDWEMESIFSRDSVAVRRRQLDNSQTTLAVDDDAMHASAGSTSDGTVFSFDARPPPVQVMRA
jgi:hypothetical protein